MLCEQAHYPDGEASILHSTFQVTFLVLHSAAVSELPDENLD
jgi:hypothetical protein